MASRIKDASGNAMVDALCAPLTTLDIYTGGQPAAGGAASGTLLGSFTGLVWDAAAARVGAVDVTPPPTCVAGATGTAGWGRFRNSGNTLALDGLVGAEITLPSTAVVSGGTLTLTGATFTQPNG